MNTAAFICLRRFSFDTAAEKESGGQLANLFYMYLVNVCEPLSFCVYATSVSISGDKISGITYNVLLFLRFL